MPPIPIQHKNIQIQHKTQTRANDCWYACIQMLRTHRAHQKSKPQGAGVRIHRNANTGIVWGQKLGASDPQFQNILKSNNLIIVPALLSDAGYIQGALDEHGPLMVLGDFFSIGPKQFGHWIVITGTAPNEKVHIHDPAWIPFGGGARTVPAAWLWAKKHASSPVIANHPSAWE